MHKHLLSSISVDSPIHNSSGHHKGPSMEKRTERILAAGFILLGLACMLWTHEIHRIFPFLLCAVMLLLGTHHIYYGIRIKEYLCKETKLIANGVMYFVLAIVILIRHQNADALIGGIWGVIGLMTGVEELNAAIYHFSREERFEGLALRAVIELVLALLLLIDPMNAVGHHVFILGMELIFEGIKLFMPNDEELEAELEAAEAADEAEAK